MNKKILVTILIIGLLTAFGLIISNKEGPPQVSDQPQVPPQNTEKEALSFTIEEISRHADAQDCYLLIDKKVYDVTQYIKSARHPGGKALLEGCGKDATSLYQERPMGSKTPHSLKANDMLEKYYIGNLEE